MRGLRHALLAQCPQSGHRMKQAVDHSTRFFWVAGYGQIYPELRRLAAEGPIAGEDLPAGCNGARPPRRASARREE